MDEMARAISACIESQESGWTPSCKQGFKECVAVASVGYDQLLLIETLLQKMLADRVDITNRLQGISDQLKEHESTAADDLHSGIEMLQRRALCAELEASALRKQMSEQDAVLTRRSKQYVEQYWQFNRGRVVMSAMRQVLEELLQGRDAEHVRELFASKYAAQVKLATTKGLVSEPPEESQAFAEGMPSTRRFIMDVLRTQAKK